jgi:hypothetical protein
MVDDAESVSSNRPSLAGHLGNRLKRTERVEAERERDRAVGLTE